MLPEQRSPRLYSCLLASELETINVNEPIHVHLPQGDAHFLEKKFEDCQDEDSEATLEYSLGYDFRYAAFLFRHVRSVVYSIPAFDDIDTPGSCWNIVFL